MLRQKKLKNLYCWGRPSRNEIQLVDKANYKDIEDQFLDKSIEVACWSFSTI